MEQNHKLGLFVSYYLARFDKEAYENLGFGKQAATHKRIGELLGAKPATVKNWRDEFDPLFGHRVGWYQRAMIPSRVSVVEALENLDEPAVRAIVLDILSGKLTDTDERTQLLSVVQTDNKKKDTSVFIVRGPTGKKAEDFFQKYYRESNLPVEGILIDCRDLGVGYDFKIETNNKKYFIEVKGLAEIIGGIAFTNKEWSTARKEREKYYLCVVSNIKNLPKVKFIQDPYSKLNAKKRLHTTVQVNWCVSPKELSIQ